MPTRVQSEKPGDEAAPQDVPVAAASESGAGSTAGESSRKPADERPNAFNAAAWLMEGATGILEEVRHSDLGLSKEFWRHAYTARKESLLAMRALLDSLIARCDSLIGEDDERQQRRKRRGSVNIEF